MKRIKAFFRAAWAALDMVFPIVVLYCVVDGWFITDDWTTWEGLVVLLLLGMQRK